ncbi:RDD family protein [Dokdonella sp.]|uniref:RDD family protein n=1 Tax=Dokdonella sp. TaxID=2291710 RepID=UPI0025C61C69|nr:RDD family protein [Dokdonella sp.]MBX3687791.1 RDD family protein [Dokdonella sp.]
MSGGSYALVLTGDILPAFDAATVWPRLAVYLRLDADKLQARLVARAPLTIKQGDDLGKLQTLASGIAALGAETEICAPDGRGDLFVVLAGGARGPVPRVFVDDRIERGLWPRSIQVADVGSSQWQAYSARADSAPPPPPAEEPVAAFDAEAQSGRDTLRSYRAAPAVDSGHSLAATATPTTDALGALPLPAGATIHAGFWRRCAALGIDGLLIGLVLAGIQVMLLSGTLVHALQGGRVEDLASLIGTVMLIASLAFVGQWLYFALFECSSWQATPGKRALGLKVVDDNGHRIGFGRASGRHFAKILSGMIFNIGYLMAGLTARKQALHDYVASTLVVFRAVEPGNPPPAQRPPMPWYGWLINLLMFGLPLAVCAVALVILGGASTGLLSQISTH